jgi:hypothetical protein
MQELLAQSRLIPIRVYGKGAAPQAQAIVKPQVDGIFYGAHHKLWSLLLQLAGSPQ